jgi:hypothetical protein
VTKRAQLVPTDQARRTIFEESFRPATSPLGWLDGDVVGAILGRVETSEAAC